MHKVNLSLSTQSTIQYNTVHNLNLFPGVKRLIQSWPAVKVYFLSLGIEECSKLELKFIEK